MFRFDIPLLMSWLSIRTQADGSYTFFGDECRSGYFGVPSAPVAGAAPFECVNNGHIIGLNVV